MEGSLDALAEVVVIVATIVAAVVTWMVRMVWLGIYYTFHPHQDYLDHLF